MCIQYTNNKYKKKIIIQKNKGEKKSCKINTNNSVSIYVYIKTQPLRTEQKYKRAEQAPKRQNKTARQKKAQERL